MSQQPDPTRAGHPAAAADAAADAADAADVDAVPSDPPVPITVWRTPVAGDGGLLGHPLAARLLAAYTRRGDTVLDATTPPDSADAVGPGGDPVLAGAAAAAGRAHRTIPRRGRDAMDDGIEQAALAVCRWPLPRAGLIDPVIALGGMRRRLRPGGVLAVIVPAPPPGTGPAQLGPVVRAVTTAGLCYLQHIVAMHAAADGEDIVPAATEAGLAAVRARVGGAAHLPAHTDVLVFTRPGHAGA
jgi:hypothetical protein